MLHTSLSNKQRNIQATQQDGHAKYGTRIQEACGVVGQEARTDTRLHIQHLSKYDTQRASLSRRKDREQRTLSYSQEHNHNHNHRGRAQEHRTQRGHGQRSRHMDLRHAAHGRGTSNRARHHTTQVVCLLVRQEALRHIDAILPQRELHHHNVLLCLVLHDPGLLLRYQGNETNHTIWHPEDLDGNATSQEAYNHTTSSSKTHQASRYDASEKRASETGRGNACATNQDGRTRFKLKLITTRRQRRRRL